MRTEDAKGVNDKGPGLLLALGLSGVRVGHARVLPARFATLAAAAAAAGTCEATAARFLRFGFIDGQAAPLELLLIELFARGTALGAVRHLDEPEAAGLAGRVIANQPNRGDVADRREKLFELLL